jgi:hypothetical protein
VEDLCEAIFCARLSPEKNVNEHLQHRAARFDTMKKHFRRSMTKRATEKGVFRFQRRGNRRAAPSERNDSHKSVQMDLRNRGKESFVSIEKAVTRSVSSSPPKHSNRDALIRKLPRYLENGTDTREKPPVTNRAAWKKGALNLQTLFLTASRAQPMKRNMFSDKTAGTPARPRESRSVEQTALHVWGALVISGRNCESLDGLRSSAAKREIRSVPL